MWNTNLQLSHPHEVLSRNNISIDCSIFQGDLLSPLIFCIALIHVNLNITRYGYKTDKKISHLFYIDDLKLYGNSNSEAKSLLHSKKAFSDENRMEFGADECARATLKKKRD